MSKKLQGASSCSWQLHQEGKSWKADGKLDRSAVSNGSLQVLARPCDGAEQIITLQMEADSQTVTERLLVTFQVMLSDLQIHGILLPLLCSEKFEKMVHDRPNETLSVNKGP